MMRKMLSILLALVMLTACLPAVAEGAADMVAKGDEYLAAGDLTRALASYQLAQKLQPEEEAAYLGEANVLILQGDAAGAAAVVDAMLERNPASPGAWGLKCRIDALQGDVSAFEADVIFAEVCGANLKDAYMAAATMYLAANMPEKAADVLAKAMAGSTDETQQQTETAQEKLARANAACEAGDYETARNLFAELAEGGNAEAQYNFGEMYYYGLGVAQSYEEAVRWYRAAAEQGYLYAQHDLGYMYETGLGVAQSYEEAVKWFRAAADQGDAYAQYNLGFAYYSGLGVTQSYEEAVKWFQAAAEQGDADAQYNLGIVYYYGQGVTQSYEEAVKWFRAAADQGDAYAQNNLGYMYENGQCVAQSYEEAVKWYQISAEQGFSTAQYNLGTMYENGRGVAQSNAEAIKWYQLAADQGDADAQAALQRLTAAAATSPASAWPMMREDFADDDHVLGSSFHRDHIGSIEFLGCLDGVPADAWDVSANQDGSVMAWVTAGADGLNDLHIAGNGGVRLPENCGRLFSNYSRVKEIHFGSCVSTADVTNMNLMFWGCYDLTALDVSGFDTANVTDMSWMFVDCSGLTALDVSGFDTANVTDMSCMFWDCYGLTALDLSHFNTANVTDMSWMFLACSGLTALDVSGFDTANVTDMSSMFGKCAGLTALDVSHFNTANVTYMRSMFYGSSGLTALDVSHFDTANVTDMNGMFSDCLGLQSILVSRQFVIPENASNMFENCPAGGLTYID